MPSVAGIVSVLHGIVLLAFVGVTASSMFAAVRDRLRLRSPLFTWRRPGMLRHMLVGPGLFLLLVTAGFGHAWWTGRSVPAGMLVGYPIGGLCWAAATWARHTVAVTEYGIARGLGPHHPTVVWSRVVDYAPTTRGERPHMVVLYQGMDDERRRLDLSVPPARASAVEQVIERKLAPRLSMPDAAASDREALDRLGDEIDLL